MIYIIRHGQTEVNHRQALQGRSDFPLNDAGIAQAERAAEGLKGILEVLTPDAHGSYWSKYIGNCAVYCASHEKETIGVPFELTP